MHSVTDSTSGPISLTDQAAAQRKPVEETTLLTERLANLEETADHAARRRADLLTNHNRLDARVVALEAKPADDADADARPEPEEIDPDAEVVNAVPPATAQAVTAAEDLMARLSDPASGEEVEFDRTSYIGDGLRMMHTELIELRKRDAKPGGKPLDWAGLQGLLGWDKAECNIVGAHLHPSSNGPLCEAIRKLHLATYAGKLRAAPVQAKNPRHGDRVFASTGAEPASTGNIGVGVTAHCMCGHVFADDIVACAPRKTPQAEAEPTELQTPVFDAIVEQLEDPTARFVIHIDPAHPIGDEFRNLGAVLVRLRAEVAYLRAGKDSAARLGTGFVADLLRIKKQEKVERERFPGKVYGKEAQDRRWREFIDSVQEATGNEELVAFCDKLMKQTACAVDHRLHTLENEQAEPQAPISPGLRAWIDQTVCDLKNYDNVNIRLKACGIMEEGGDMFRAMVEALKSRPVASDGEVTEGQLRELRIMADDHCPAAWAADEIQLIDAYRSLRDKHAKCGVLEPATWEDFCMATGFELANVDRLRAGRALMTLLSDKRLHILAAPKPQEPAG